MVATNPITGDLIQTKNKTKDYDEGYDRIFSQKSFGVVQDLLGNTWEKCQKRCWIEVTSNGSVSCKHPHCKGNINETGKEIA